MKLLKVILTLLFLGGAVGAAVYEYRIYVDPCGRPLQYAVGEFDTKFGISKEYFASQILKAEGVWEGASKKELFVYNPEASFKINLIYDTRQATTDAKQRADFGLTAVEESFNKIDAEFSSLKSAYESRSREYEVAKANFDKAKAEFERQASFWNSRGGAPKSEYDKLNKEEERLRIWADSLNAEASSLNQKTQELNEALTRRNSAASEYNKMVAEYNRRFGHGVEFNQAEYTGSSINVYQFTNGSDLELALAHELGHALRMDHIENSRSIMYYESEEGGTGVPNPTLEDLAELRRVCKLK